MSTQLRRAPHRVSLDEVGPQARRVSVKDAMARLRARGLGEVVSADLEVYRLVMSPAEFKRLCHRLDKAVADHWEQTRQAACTDIELPFGTDIEAETKRERLAAWSHRPDGEPLPTTWQVDTEFQIPGRLKLVADREFTVRGLRGRLRFRHAVTTTTGEVWIDGWDIEGRCRSVDPGRVRVVHTKSKVRPWHERAKGTK